MNILQSLIDFLPNWLVWTGGIGGAAAIALFIASGFSKPVANFLDMAVEFLKPFARVVADNGAHALSAVLADVRELKARMIFTIILPTLVLGGCFFDDGTPKVTLNKKPEYSRQHTAKAKPVAKSKLPTIKKPPAGAPSLWSIIPQF